ncbi:MAG TPA: hypothetical protein VLJ39_02115, partial [Tepidisphaeraceae bacterium]|nr:hypothetical protein [Tepidisphaeraceae bacterium]
SEGGLFDPTVGQPFEPKSPADWEAAIYSGTVSIGCFVTPFYFAGLRTHVYHLNNAAGAPLRAHAVLNEPRGYPLIPNKRFAAVKLADVDDAPTAGTYVVSSRCEDLLDSLPRRRVIVHVDLDYFINDFNGNPEARRDLPDPALVAQGRRKLDRFFEILQARRIDVEHWVIATSPGFCSACHWSWLLNEFAEKIGRFDSAY